MLKSLESLGQVVCTCFLSGGDRKFPLKAAARPSSAVGACSASSWAAPAAVPVGAGAPMGGVCRPVNGQADLFAGLGRDGYMQARVHRRLHPQAVLLESMATRIPHPVLLHT